MEDSLNREVQIGDWIAYKDSYHGLCAGVIVGFTPKENPRVLKYDPDATEGEEDEFSMRPKAVIHHGFIKMEAPTKNLPNGI